MLSDDIKTLLINLSKSDIEFLSGSEQTRLYDLGIKYIEKCKKLSVQKNINNLLNSIDIEDVAFYNYFIRAEKLKRPKIRDDIGDWRWYLEKLLNLINAIKSKHRAYQKSIIKLSKLKLENCIKLIEKLNSEDKKLISLMANLTKTTPDGVSKLSLGSSLKSYTKWLREFKKNELPGVKL